MPGGFELTSLNHIMQLYTALVVGPRSDWGFSCVAHHRH